MEVFPEYKAQRSAMPEELKVQLDHLDQILDAMNIPAVRAEGFEADDALATMSRADPRRRSSSSSPATRTRCSSWTGT